MELVGGALNVLSVVLHVQGVEAPLVGLVGDADGSVAVVLDEGVGPVAGGGVDRGLHLAAGRRDRNVVQLQHGILVLRRRTHLDSSPLALSSEGTAIGAVHWQGSPFDPIVWILLGPLSAKRTIVAVAIKVVS